MYEPTEYQKTRLVQCPICKMWRNKAISICPYPKCGELFNVLTYKHGTHKKHISIERGKKLVKSFRLWKKKGWTNQRIADKYGYAAESSVRDLLRKYPE